MTAIAADTELLNDLYQAQIEHLKDTIEREGPPWPVEDDGGDYMQSALELANIMFDMARDQDVEKLKAFLNTPLPTFHYDRPITSAGVPDNPEYFAAVEQFRNDNGFEHLALYAGDGIAAAFYDLNCPALEEH